MNTDTSYTSITNRLKQHKRRRGNTSPGCGSFDVSQLVPERPLPDWVRQRVKGTRSGHKSTTAVQHKGNRGGKAKKLDPSSTTSGTMMLDLNNMRKDWKSVSTRRMEAVQRARISQNRQAEPVRPFPGEIRPTGTLSDSPVALFAQTSNTGKTRKKLGSPGDDGLEVGDGTTDDGEDAISPLLMKNTYLTLDLSKLPLEVSVDANSISQNRWLENEAFRSV